MRANSYEDFSLSASCLYHLDKESFKCPTEHPDYKYLTEQILVIKNSRDNKEEITSSLKSIRNVLGRMFGREFEISIIDTELGSSSDFFGVNVYPDEHGCERIAWGLINQKAYESGETFDSVANEWMQTYCWQIDLDSKLFFDTSFLFNPSDIIAMLIFNIEDTIFNATPALMCASAIRSQLDSNSILVSKFARASICRRFFVVLVILACRIKSYPYDKVEHVGGSCLQYGALNNAYNDMVRKVVLYSGNSKVDIPKAVIHDQLNHAVQSLFACIDNMRYNTTMIREMIEKLLIMEKSPFVATLFSNILQDIGDYNRKQVVSMESGITSREMLELNDKAIKFRQKVLLEQAKKTAIGQFNRIAQESLMDLLDGIGNMKKISQKDIDMVRVASQKIQDADDKFYVLDDLHSKLEVVEASIALLDSRDPEKMKRVKLSRQVLMDQKKQLDAIREDILKKPIEPPHATKLRIDVDYPKGYDG